MVGNGKRKGKQPRRKECLAAGGGRVMESAGRVSQKQGSI
jgi:hypothetical protein